MVKYLQQYSLHVASLHVKVEENMPKRSCPKLTCKPKALHIGPLQSSCKHSIPLLHEELEALFLADVKGLYHEACAQAMDVSRPTFAKLLKSARRKCATMFLQGHALHIDPKPAKLNIAMPSDDGKTLSNRFQSARYFVLIEWDDLSSKVVSIYENPIYLQLISSGVEPKSDEEAKGLGAGRFIPPLLKDAAIVYAIEIGEGMVRNIEGLGLSVQLLPKSLKGESFAQVVKQIE